MSKDTHIIRKQILDISVSESFEQTNFYNNINDWFHKKILNSIDEVLNDHTTPNEWLFIDSLYVDLGNVSEYELNNLNLNWFKDILGKELGKKVRLLSDPGSHSQNRNMESVHKNQSEMTENVTAWESLSSEFTGGRINKQLADIKTLFIYLRSGTFPEWQNYRSVKELEKRITKLINKHLVEEILKMTHSLSYVIKRLVLQFSPEFILFLVKNSPVLSENIRTSGIKTFLEYIEYPGSKVSPELRENLRRMLLMEILKTDTGQGIHPGKEILLETIKDFRNTLSNPLKTELTQLIRIYSQTIDERQNTSSINEAFKWYLLMDEKEKIIGTSKSTVYKYKYLSSNKARNISKGNGEDAKLQSDLLENEKSTLPHRVKSRDSEDAIEDAIKIDDDNKIDNEYYVKNAGLVLIAPYLGIFFEEIGYAKEKQLINPNKALFILHYLASKNLKPNEPDLVFNKLLCGLPIIYPAMPIVEIDQSILVKADDLLKEVIRNWKVLKDTSPDGLREGFLQRNGKLRLSDNGWNLIVEQNPIDILLDKLPWGMGVIQLPWMKELIYTDWI